MTSAAVGFQCPECVKSGRKETRAGLARYGGKHASNPMTTSIVLIVINVIVWLAIMATGLNGAVERALALLPMDTQWTASERVTGVSGGAWWQVLTSAFTHQQVWHLAMNMIALYMLGPAVENIVGRVRFLAIYLLSAVAGSTAVMWLSEPYGQTVGASGAIYGLMGALLVIALRHKGDTRQLWTLIGINVVLTLTGLNYISWQGHLGGFVGGLVATAVLAFAPRVNRSRWQWIGLGLLLALCVVAIAARAFSLASGAGITAL